MDREQSYFHHKMRIRSVHDEMRRRSITNNKRSEINTMVECERSRRLSMMEQLLGSKSELAKEMQKTNRRLSFVHNDLKAAFQRKQVTNNLVPSISFLFIFKTIDCSVRCKKSVRYDVGCRAELLLLRLESIRQIRQTFLHPTP